MNSNRLLNQVPNDFNSTVDRCLDDLLVISAAQSYLNPDETQYPGVLDGAMLSPRSDHSELGSFFQWSVTEAQAEEVANQGAFIKQSPGALFDYLCGSRSLSTFSEESYHAVDPSNIISNSSHLPLAGECWVHKCLRNTHHPSLDAIKSDGKQSQHFLVNPSPQDLLAQYNPVIKPDTQLPTCTGGTRLPVEYSSQDSIDMAHSSKASNIMKSILSNTVVSQTSNSMLKTTKAKENTSRPCLNLISLNSPASCIPATEPGFSVTGWIPSSDSLDDILLEDDPSFAQISSESRKVLGDATNQIKSSQRMPAACPPKEQNLRRPTGKPSQNSGKTRPINKNASHHPRSNTSSPLGKKSVPRCTPSGRPIGGIPPHLARSVTINVMKKEREKVEDSQRARAETTMNLTNELAQQPENVPSFQHVDSTKCKRKALSYIDLNRTAKVKLVLSTENVGEEGPPDAPRLPNLSLVRAVVARRRTENDAKNLAKSSQGASCIATTGELRYHECRYGSDYEVIDTEGIEFKETSQVSPVSMVTVTK